MGEVSECYILFILGPETEEVQYTALIFANTE